MLEPPGARKTKSPLSFSRQRAEDPNPCWFMLDRHPRERAARVVMMAVVAISQHRS